MRNRIPGVKKFRATLSPTATLSPADLENETLVRYLADIPRETTLTNEQVASLVDRMRAGDAQAREDLITANLPLVVAVAMFYRGRGVEVNDLIQEGNIGLMKAVEKYLPEKAFTFSTYAIWWIHREIFNALSDQAGAISISDRLYRRLRTRVRIICEIQAGTGRAATKEEIQAAMGLTEEQMANTDAAANAVSVASIEDPIDHDASRQLEEVIPSPEPEDSEFDLAQIAMVPYALRMLKPTEEMVLRLRYRIGLTGEALRYREIGALFGLTKARALMVAQEGIATLRRLLDQTTVRRFGRTRPSLEAWLGLVCGRCDRAVATSEAFCSPACAQAWWGAWVHGCDEKRQSDTAH